MKRFKIYPRQLNKREQYLYDLRERYYYFLLNTLKTAINNNNMKNIQNNMKNIQNIQR